MAIHPFIHPYMDAVLAIWSLGSFAASLRPEAERARARARARACVCDSQRPCAATVEKAGLFLVCRGDVVFGGTCRKGEEIWGVKGKV